MDIKQIRKIERQFRKAFVDEYGGETNPLKVLDISHLKDDPDGLVEEMARHPAVYTYWVTQHQEAQEKYKSLQDRFEMFKATKLSQITETLKSQGVSHPTAKLIESTFHNMFREFDIYKKYKDQIDKWKNRANFLSIIERGVKEKSKMLECMNFSMMKQMSTGLMQPTRKRKSSK